MFPSRNVCLLRGMFPCFRNVSLLLPALASNLCHRQKITSSFYFCIFLQANIIFLISKEDLIIDTTGKQVDYFYTCNEFFMRYSINRTVIIRLSISNEMWSKCQNSFRLRLNFFYTQIKLLHDIKLTKLQKSKTATKMQSPVVRFHLAAC